MRKLILPAKRINARQLREELLAAGVPLLPLASGEIPRDAYLNGSDLVLIIAADDDQFDAAATQIIADHTPPPELTPQQAAAQQAKQRIASKDPADLANRAAIRVLQRRLIRALEELNITREVLRQTRSDLRQLAQRLADGGLPIVVPGVLPLPNVEVLTEQQAIAQWQQQIDAETAG